jgi:uncharacterized protein (TIGR03083 family)
VSPLPAPRPSKHETLRSVRSERARTLAFLRTQTQEVFDAPALPGWRVREVVAHLITLDRAAVTGAMLRQILGHGTDRLERWNDRAVASWADRPPATLLDGLQRWGRRFHRQMRAIPEPMYRARIPTIWGRLPGAFAVWIRAYDEFIHRQDIRRALGLPDDDADATAIAEFLLSVQPFHAAAALSERGRTGRVAVTVIGEPLAVWIYDLGAGVCGPENGAEGADAHVSAAATPMIMAAAGRGGGFEAMESSGALTIEGDADLARSFLAEMHLV